MTNKIISTAIGIIAGITFMMIVVLLKMIIIPEFVFTQHPILRFIGLIIFFAIISAVRSYLMENETYSKNQKILIAIILILFIATILISI